MEYITIPERVKNILKEHRGCFEPKKRIKTKRCLRRKGYVTNERNSIRPTLDVNGIWGGYTGEDSHYKSSIC
jgi:hypothetical protein